MNLSSRILTGCAAALLLCGSLLAVPAAAADSFGSSIYLDILNGERAFFLFRGDGTGIRQTAYTKTAFRYTSDDNVHFSFTYGNSEPVSVTVSNIDGVFRLTAEDDSFTDLIYLQEYDAAYDTKSFRPGDMTQDGNLSLYDVMLLKDYLLGSYQLSKVQQALADFNRDGILDAADLTLTKRNLADPPAEPPFEQSGSVMLNAMDYSQHPDYPTGCESIALYILLKYYDTDVTPEQIIEALPKGPNPYYQDSVRYGANPEKEFVGDPRNSWSYGVFNGPIAQVAEQFRSGVITQTGAAVEDMYPILDAGNPVVAWYTTTPDRDIFYKNEWLDYQTGTLVRWPGGEHAVVVCGYDGSAGTVTYRDPNTGGSRTLSAEQFRKVFDELGGRIVYYNS